MTVRWITPLLGTASADETKNFIGVQVIDVRDLVDKGGNRTEAVKEKIMAGVSHLKNGAKTIVCCDYGISRSNAIAAGILAVHEQMPFADAVRTVQKQTGEKEIKLEPLNVVRRAIESRLERKRTMGKRTILVTGAHGFVGTQVSRRLKSKFEVIAPTHEQLDIAQGGTQLSLLVDEHDVDCILHLANPRVYTSNSALGETLVMLRNVLDVCVSQDVSLIYPSSWEIYTGYAGTLLADEAVAALPRGPYGETKHLAESMIKHWRQTTGLRCALIRSSPVYGSGSNKPKFIYNFVEKARKSETIVTHRYLNGEPALDLLHIDDFLAALVMACEQEYVGTLNVGTGMATSTRLIAEILKHELGSNSAIEQTEIETNVACVAMNSKKAEQSLGWQPRVALHDGLKQLISDYLDKGNEN